MDYNAANAFLVGIMGAAHCFGMCGGLIGAFSNQLPPIKPNENKLTQQLKFLIPYNLGRIFSYTLAGALVGGLAAGLSFLFDINQYLLVLRIFAGLMMIAMGLYIAKIWFGLIQIERLGYFIWRFIKPLTSKILPIVKPSQAFFAGSLWGWLPCGLVYSTLTWSAASGSAASGAVIMLSFGLGTLPALLSAGVAAKLISDWVQKRAVRLVAGSILIMFGLQTLFIALNQL